MLSQAQSRAKEKSINAIKNRLFSDRFCLHQTEIAMANNLPSSCRAYRLPELPNVAKFSKVSWPTEDFHCRAAEIAMKKEKT